MRNAMLTLLSLVTAFKVSKEAPAASSPINKGSVDDTIYVVETLSNNINVVYAQNKLFNISSCALAVGVGSAKDPLEIEGLAHFVEHMLFAGPENDSPEKSFDEFLGMHGGYTNAVTSLFNTTYYFSISSKHFEGAMRMFSQFFTSPLQHMNDKAIKTAISEIDSEFYEKKNVPGRRLAAIINDIMKDGVMRKKFTSGNRATFTGRNMSQAASEFVKENYRTENMTLVICSDRDLEYMRELSKFFEAVPSSTQPTKEDKTLEIEDRLEISEIENISKKVFKEEFLSKIVHFKPVASRREMVIVVTLPCLRKYFKAAPLGYIYMLFMSTQSSGLLERLKNENLAYGASFSYSVESDMSMINIGVSLTEKGLEEYRKIISMVHKFITAMRPSQRLYSAISDYITEKFNTQPTESAINVALTIANNMLSCPVEHAMDRGYLFADFNEELISRCINGIADISQWIVFLSDANLAPGSGMVEKYFEVQYEIGDDCAECLSIPVDEFDITDKPRDQTQQINSLVISGERHLTRRMYSNGEISFVFDSDFKVPKLELDILLASEDVQQNPIRYYIYFSLILDSFKASYLDMISILDVNIRVKRSIEGIGIQFSGRSEYVTAMAKFFILNIPREEIPISDVISENKLESIKQALVDSYDEVIHSSPHNRLAETLLDGVIKRDSTEDEMVKIRGIRIEDLRINRSFFCRILAVGNTRFNKVEDVFKCIDSEFLGSPVAKPMTVKIKDQKSFKFTTYDQENNAVGLFYRINRSRKDVEFTDHAETHGNSDVVPDRHTFNMAVGNVILETVSYGFIDALRRQKELGYIVYCNITEVLSAGYMAFVVQSHVSTAEIKDNILKFVSGLKMQIQAMGNDEFERYKDNVINGYRASVSSLEIYSNMIRRQRARGNIDLNWIDKMIAAVSSLKKADLLEAKLWSKCTEVMCVRKDQDGN